MRTANPALNERTFSGIARYDGRGPGDDCSRNGEQDRASIGLRDARRVLDLAPLLRRSRPRIPLPWPHT